MAKHKPTPVEEMPEPEMQAETSLEETVETTVPEEKAEVAESQSTGPKVPEALKGETIVVNKAGFAKIYKALLQNKAGFYNGAGAKKLMREVLMASTPEEVQEFHEYLRHIY